MATPFQRTTRALERDGIGFSRYLNLLLFAFFAAWVGWFFFGALKQWETSDYCYLHLDPQAQDASLHQDGAVYFTALFEPAAVLGGLQPGQMAVFEISDIPHGRFGLIVGDVLRLDDHVTNGKIPVTFVVRPPPQLEHLLLPGLTGSVRVYTHKASPFQMVLRALGEPVFSESKQGATS